MSDKPPGTPPTIPLPILAHLARMAHEITVPWKGLEALTVNHARLRVMRFQGHHARWHHHDADECYVVIEGELLVELEGEPAQRLVPWDAYVVRAGVTHRPFALPIATVLVIT